MSEASRPQVTITLGRTGQVVKRAGATVDSAFSGSVPLIGTKRSIRDRLGTNVELNSKRRRGNGNISSGNSSDGMDDEAVPLRKDDLRYKIMQKSRKKGTQSGSLLNGVDLREMLSRQARPSTTSLGTQKLISEEKNGRHYISERSEVKPEPRGAGQHMPEARDIIHQLPNTREVRLRMPETREVREQMQEMMEYRDRIPEMREVRDRMPEMMEVRDRIPEMREVRDQMPETVAVRHHMPEPRDDWQRMREPAGASIMRQVPSTRGGNPVPQIDALRNSYSSLTTDCLRRRSPDGILVNSRGASPPSEEELRRRPLVRPYDDVRKGAYLGNDGLQVPRPMGSTSYMTNSSLVARGPVKPVGPMLAAPPPGVILHRSSYMVNEQHTVEGLLRALSLEKYVINFKAEEVDMHALRQMGDDDLKDLGIPMGPRKKILLALLPRRRQV